MGVYFRSEEKEVSVLEESLSPVVKRKVFKRKVSSSSKNLMMYNYPKKTKRKESANVPDSQ